VNASCQNAAQKFTTQSLLLFRSRRVKRNSITRVYIHQSEGTPGRDAGSGWIQEAILRINNARVEGSFSKFPVTLGDGNIQLGSQTFDNEIPVPLRHNGSIALRLIGSESGEVVSFTGSGAELELLGEPEYVEDFRL
jgi:hypothetical protein